MSFDERGVEFVWFLRSSLNDEQRTEDQPRCHGFYNGLTISMTVPVEYAVTPMRFVVHLEPNAD